MPWIFPLTSPTPFVWPLSENLEVVNSTRERYNYFSSNIYATQECVVFEICASDASLKETEEQLG